MPTTTSQPPLITPRVYQQIVSSKRLRQALVPENPNLTPYEVLDYDATLILHDVNGTRATFRRRQRVRFLQHGVAAILDHFWGKGVIVSYYSNTAGTIGDSFKDEGRRHVVIELPRLMAKGEELEFEVTRTAEAAFTDSDGRLETIIDHPVYHLTRSVIFPKARPCLEAVLEYGEDKFHLPVLTLASGKTALSFEAPRPGNEAVLTVRWRW